MSTATENHLSNANIEPTSVLLDFRGVAYGLLWLRLVLYSAVYFGLLLLQLMQDNFLNLALYQPINILMAVSFISHAVALESLTYSAAPKKVMRWIFLFDSAFIVAFMAIFASLHSVFLFFILINCALAGVSLGTQFGLQLGLWSAFLMNALIAVSPAFSPDQLQASWLVNNLSILVVSALGGFLGDQIRFITSDLQVSRQEIKSLTDLNELIVEHIPSGILMVSPKREILRSNRGAAKIFGDLSLEGKALRDIAPELVAELQAFETDSKPQVFRRGEVDHFNFRREKSILEVIISSARGKNDESQHILLLQNVTEVKNLAFELQQKEKLAAIGQLAAGIAHEIRNPLASISGSVQLLQANLKVDTAEEGKLFKIVLKEIDRLNNLITEFLDFVRPNLRIEDPIQINTLLKEVSDVAKLNQKLTRDVNLKINLKADTLIYGHYDKLKQAILNILINAYQAMGDTLRPEIDIESYDSEDKRVVVLIRDNGSGISKDNLRRIFEPFHTTKTNGTGLGLAITHKIIESHGAEIRVESEPGNGTQFALIFPTKDLHPRSTQ